MTYAELLAATKQDPIEADYHALRMAQTRDESYHPYANDSDNLKRLREALEAQDWPAALEAIDALLAFNYLDIEAHIAADYVHTRREDAERALYHRAFAKGLLDSILASGRGRDYQTAWIVIRVAEEYAVLRVLGLKPHGQALQQHEGHWFDMIEAEHRETGRMVRLYFNIDLPRNWLDDHMTDLVDGEL